MAAATLNNEINNSGSRRYVFYFQIDDQPAYRVENLDFQTYLKIKHDNNEAFAFITRLIEL
ncbi:Protein of unknown function [Cotesia congregata]|uniref:Uncharacterized protein n=1 Tax=Cotesia congregata TaxID=51543 RepID=A0A8J2HAP1_COTCN|nr:Protein of unknown function [Cotesia congregata]